MAIVTALLMFVIIHGYVYYLDEHTGWDKHISQWFVSLRNPQLDGLVLAITLLADWYVSLCMIAALVLLLLAERRLWLGFYLTCTFFSTTLGVSIIKSLTQRPRPALSESALTLMSFPSGHAARGVLLFGVAALLLSYGRKPGIRIWAYAVAGISGALVALSRVYLGLHWISDVLAGAALATTMVIAFDWQLRLTDDDSRQFPAAIVLLTWSVVYIVYCWAFAHKQASIYGLSLSF